MNANQRSYTVKAATNQFCRWNRKKELIVDANNRYDGERLNAESRSFAQALRTIRALPDEALIAFQEGWSEWLDGYVAP